MIAAAVGYAAVKIFTTLAFPYTLIVVVAWTTVCWLAATLLTAPEPDDRLIEFYRRTRPDGPGWKSFAARTGEAPPGPLAGLLLDWIAGVVLVYASLFGIGNLLLGDGLIALICFAAAAAAIAFIWFDLSRRGWQTITG
jgi:hypothetical protein